jgi:cytidine deaminase
LANLESIDMTENVNEIHDELHRLMAMAYAPYSDFAVAAAVVDEHGNIHYGVNVENQSFPVGTCAEAGAICALRVAGGKRIRKLYLLSNPNIGALPCGACRQRLAELGDEDTTVITFDKSGNQQTYSLGELLPHSFRFKEQRAD